MESLPPQTHRLAHRWNRASSLGDWFSGMNILSLLMSFAINIRKILYRNPHLSIVLETGPRKQLMWILRMRVDQLFCKWKRANDSGGIQCTWAQSHLLIILIHYFLFSCFYRKMWQRWWMKEELIEMARIRAIQEAICGFLLAGVINPKGEFHGDLRTSVAKEDPMTSKLIHYYSWCLIICNISSTFELRSVPYMNSICMYIYYIYIILY